MIICCILLMFASLKFSQLVDRQNPSVSQVLQQSYYSDSDEFNMQENRLKIAFTLENYIEQKKRLDPRYVKPFVRIVSSFDGEDIYKELHWHECTQADFDGFYPVAKKSEFLLSLFKTDPDRSLLCIDWDKHSVSLRGSE